MFESFNLHENTTEKKWPASYTCSVFCAGALPIWGSFAFQQLLVIVLDNTDKPRLTAVNRNIPLDVLKLGVPICTSPQCSPGYHQWYVGPISANSTQDPRSDRPRVTLTFNTSMYVNGQIVHELFFPPINVRNLHTRIKWFSLGFDPTVVHTWQVIEVSISEETSGHLHARDHKLIQSWVRSHSPPCVTGDVMDRKWRQITGNLAQTRLYLPDIYSP